MQKLISIPLLILYLAVSVGIQGVHHFCGDNLVDVALFTTNQAVDCGEMSCCEAPQPSDDDECCTDVQFVVFYESERSLTLASYNFDLKFPDHVDNRFFPLLIEETEDNNPPPIHKINQESPPSVPIYLQHHSLIFYG